MIAIRTTGRDLSRDLARSIAVIEGHPDLILWTDDELREAHEDVALLLGQVRYTTETK